MISSIIVFAAAFICAINSIKLNPSNGVLISKTDKNKKYRWNIGLSDGLKNGLASGVAAAISKSVLQPFDTVKTIQQANAFKLGPVKAALQVVRNRGVGGLWSGLGITVIGSSPSVAVYFGAYSTVKKYLSRYISPDYKLAICAVSAAIGNSFASVLRVPCEVIKQRLQAGQYASAGDAIKQIVLKDGFMSLFSNGKLTSQIVRDVPYAIFTLVSYELLQSFVSKMKSSRNQNLHQNDEVKLNIFWTSVLSVLYDSKLSNAICGSIAGGIGSFLTNPMDVVKTRLMTGQNDPNFAQYATFMKTTMKILRDEDWRSFFVGSVPRLMHKVPANGIFFLTYELTRTMLGVASTAEENNR